LRDFSPFVPVDGGLRTFYISRRPSLNFNETKNIRIPADQVDLAPAARRPEIALHYHIPQLPQVKVCVFFVSQRHLHATASPLDALVLKGRSQRED
jgi:hypothetical protein